MTRVLRAVTVVVQTAVVGFVVLVLLAVVVVPRLSGWVPLTVLSGSMAPAIPAGSQVVVVPLDSVDDAADIQLGDVVTFAPLPGDPTLVTHRVVARAFGSDGSVELTTQGDANDAVDDPVSAEQVRGVVRYHVPYAGYVATLLSGDQKDVGVTVLAVALIAFSAVQLVRYVRWRREAAGGATTGAEPPSTTDSDAAPPRAPGTEPGPPLPDTRRARRVAASRGGTRS